QTRKAKADVKGKWMVQLTALKAAADQAGQTLTIQGSSAEEMITFTDVLIGEVWLCSGQSNMQMPLKNSLGGQEDTAAADFPQMRLFQVGTNNSTRVPTDSVRGSWRVCSPSTAGSFSGVGFYYG